MVSTSTAPGSYPGRLSPHEILVVAYVEFLRWVACDYFLTAHRVDARGICFEPRSASMRGRATDLCRLAEPTAEDIPEGVWRGSGGTPRLCAEALVLLAARRPRSPGRPRGAARSASRCAAAGSRRYRRAPSVLKTWTKTRHSDESSRCHHLR